MGRGKEKQKRRDLKQSMEVPACPPQPVRGAWSRPPGWRPPLPPGPPPTDRPLIDVEEPWELLASAPQQSTINDQLP